MKRREFLKSTAVVGGALLGGLALERSVHAASDDTLKIALIGCGGRGSGAVDQALTTKGKVKLVAMADAFPDCLTRSLKNLMEKNADKIDVPADRQFSGLDSYLHAIELADVVILASPPGFRPIHFEAAVKAGKHVFMEKPVATDAPGIRQVLAAAEIAKQKNLKVGVGLQRRHETGYLETIQRLHDGGIGDIIAMRAYWNGSNSRRYDRLPTDTEMQYQIRNWYHFTWLSGDHIVEQRVHNLDVINWIKQSYPVSARGMGGRQVRVGPGHGDIFDHHAVEYEYADGSRMLSECRQIPGCWNEVGEHALGTKGSADFRGQRFTIKGEKPWTFTKKSRTPYQVEHDDLFDAIRNDKPYNEAEYGAKTTLTAIMGRMATHSGTIIEWDQALNSQLSIHPKDYTWDSQPVPQPDAHGLYPIPVPGDAAWLKRIV